MATHEALTRMNTLDLIRHLIDNLSSLLDREVEMVKVEARETAIETARGAGMLIVGGVLGLLAVTCLVVAAILALALVVPGWLAALIGFGVFGLAAAIVLLLGRGELEAAKERPFSRTRETIREDVEWARQRLTSSER